MSTSKLKDSLPELDSLTLDYIFDHVYDISGFPGESEAPGDAKLSDFLEVIKALQKFNYHHWQDEFGDLYRMAAGPLNIDPHVNSEGVPLWLAMLQAVKDLYGLSQKEMKKAIGRIRIRK